MIDNYSANSYLFFDTFNFNKNLDILKTSSLKELHHSLDPRGGALYFQKIMINRIYKSKVVRQDESTIFTGKSKFFSQAVRYLNSGSSYLSKFFLLSDIDQFRSEFNGIRSYNASNVGFFFNFSQSRGYTSSSKKLQSTTGSRLTFNNWIINYFIVSSFSSNVAYCFTDRAKRATKALPSRSFFTKNTFVRMINSSLSYYSVQFKDSLSTKIAGMTNFLRSFWFKSTLDLQNFWHQHNPYDNTGDYSFKEAKTSMMSAMVSNKFILETFVTLGHWPYLGVDITKNLKAGPRGRGFFRRYVRNQKKWRIGMAYWAKKIWRFKKTYRFWRYMRGMSKYFYRGFHMYSIFMNRLDLFVLRMFSVRNLRYARVIIDAGHVFYGDWVSKNPKMRVKRFSLVSFSKSAKNWSKIFGSRPNRKYNKKSITSDERKWSLRMLKNSSICFVRSMTHSTLTASTKEFSYRLQFGDMVDVINTESKKTNFFSLNYFYSQKAVGSAWW